jgi:glycosyltransferase involved in cell wall biosynthesis
MTVATRLAFVTPLPPAATGIADYSAEVLALLAGGYEIDVFHSQDRIETGRLPAACTVRPARELLERHRSRPYDAAVYQMGNGLDHAFLYELLGRIPGLLVLHDLVLHHSRARAFLESPEAREYALRPSDPVRRDAAARRIDAYRSEADYCYPAQAGRLAEAHLNTVGTLLPYAYPLFRIPVEASRVTAVHNAFMVEAIREEVPDAETVLVPMAAAAVPVTAADRDATRGRYGLEPGDLVVGSFGLMTPEKRIETLARAVARAAAWIPGLRLLLVGPVPDDRALAERLGRLGVADRTVIAGRVPFAELPAHIEATDIVVHLRYPTARETSAALLRVLAQARPTVISDLQNLAGIPADAVVRVDLTDEEGAVARAILRLAESPRARARLGERARRYVEREHGAAACRRGYDEAIRRTVARPDPPRRDWPAHWRDAGAP